MNCNNVTYHPDIDASLKACLVFVLSEHVKLIEKATLTVSCLEWPADIHATSWTETAALQQQQTEALSNNQTLAVKLALVI